MKHEIVKNLQQYPSEMRVLNNWVLWRLEERDGRSLKMPYQVNGYKAKSNDPKTWSSFTEALAVFIASDIYRGIGYVFDIQSRIVFIDLDHCISETGELSQVAEDVLSALPGAFVEVSQSGTGLHLFTIGSVPHSIKTAEIEIYAEKRFCAISGRIFREVIRLHEEQEGLDYVFQKYKKPEKQKALKREAVPVMSCPDSVPLSDSEILQKALKDAKFQKLYSGDCTGYGSQSEADSALCWKIVFYAGRDPVTVDRIFRTSALYRPKWDREHFSSGETYGQRTVSNACQAKIETLNEFRKKREREQFNEFVRSICDI